MAATMKTRPAGAPGRCEGCDDQQPDVVEYEARFADAPETWVPVRYCSGCAELAEANWNGETLGIRVA